MLILCYDSDKPSSPVTECGWPGMTKEVKTEMETQPVIMIVGTQCPPEVEERFNTWYNEKHIPEVLKFKGIKRATRYKIAGGDETCPKFLAVYEFESRQALEEYGTGPVRAAAGEDWLRISKETGAEMIWRVQYEAIRTWQQ